MDERRDQKRCGLRVGALILVAALVSLCMVQLHQGGTAGLAQTGPGAPGQASPVATPPPEPPPACDLQVGCYFIATATATFDNGLADSAFRYFKYVMMFAVRVLPADPGGFPIDIWKGAGMYAETLDSPLCVANEASGVLDVGIVLNGNDTLDLLIGDAGSTTAISAICGGVGGNDVPFRFPAFIPTFVVSRLLPQDKATAKGTIGPAEASAGQSGTISVSLDFVGSSPIGDLPAQSTPAASLRR